MADFISAIGSLFTFLITQMGNIATFFTSNLIGQIILGIAIFSLVLNVVLSFINKMK